MAGYYAVLAVLLLKYRVFENIMEKGAFALFNFGVCTGVESFGKQSRNYTVCSKTTIKANHVDKQYGL